MILEKLATLLKDRAFLSVATADKRAEPHAAPKFLLKVADGHIYLVDHAIARTVENLRANPRVSLSFMDLDSLEGYRVSGSAKLIEEGLEHRALHDEFERKLIKLSATRVIEGMKSGKPTEHFELEMPDKVIVIKVRIEEAVRIGRQGELFRETPPA